MKKIIICLIAGCALVISACQKTTTKPSTPTTTTPTSPYYFKFMLDGVSSDLTANFPQYMPFYENEAGGYQVANLNLFPSAGIRLTWPTGTKVKESDLLALIGKTLYFDDTAVQAEVSYADGANTPSWYSVDTADRNYNVKISNITFLRNDTTLGYALKTYVITGTCSAILDDYMTNTPNRSFAGGQFNFIICRQDN